MKAIDNDSELALKLASATLDDVEVARIAATNRVETISRDGLADSAYYHAAKAIADNLAAIEDQCVKNLTTVMKVHPLGPWVECTVGVGMKQGARLIAAIGDPHWNDAENRPRRGPAELWGYCGFAPDQIRKRGVAARWNHAAKMRAFLCAESCIKHRTSDYRAVYDNARLDYADAVHETSCYRCGPSGKPAEIGSPLSNGHKHARALRAVSKAILKDLFNESKLLARDQKVIDTQIPHVAGERTLVTTEG